MIVGFSTSCSQSSVAIFDPEGRVAFSAQRESLGRASEACLSMLQESGIDLANVTGFVADLGPGSFTGVRVGVTLAKTMAWMNGVMCAGKDAFDLISPGKVVVMPSKKGEFFVRVPGEAPIRTPSLPEGVFVGFGPGIDPAIYPHAERFAPLLSHLNWVDPVSFVPEYLIEPSISTPKKPLGIQSPGIVKS